MENKMYEYEIRLVSDEGEQKWEFEIYKKIGKSDWKYESQMECMRNAEQTCKILEKITSE